MLLIRAGDMQQRRRVWLYMVDGRNTADLASLDAHGFDTWRGHRSTRAGDLIVMYRTAPFSDIGYVFKALKVLPP